MTLLLQLLKLVFPLLREYGSSTLRMKRGGQKLTFIASAATIFILSMFVSYLNEQATTNLRLHEPLARQYQALEKNNQRLTQQLEAARQTQYICDAMLDEYKGLCPSVPKGQLVYDPEKKIMVESEPKVDAH